jgi:hypothetical protein
MLKRICTISCALMLPATFASAQTAPATTAVPTTAATTTTATIVGSASTSVLRTGTPVALKVSEYLTTKEKAVKVGQRVRMEVAEAVTLNGAIVIPAGSPAMGEITDVRNKGMWGKSGKINARALYVRVGDRQIRLSGQFDDKGTTGTAGVVTSIVVLPLAGFFVTGTSAQIAVGAPVMAFLDEDITIAFAQAAPAPLVVPVPAVVPAVLPAPPSPATSMTPALLASSTPAQPAAPTAAVVPASAPAAAAKR